MEHVASRRRKSSG